MTKSSQILLYKEEVCRDPMLVSRLSGRGRFLSPGLRLAHLCPWHPRSLLRWWEALTSWAATFIFPGILEPSGTPQACLFPSGHRQTALQLHSTSFMSYGVSVVACGNRWGQYVRQWAWLCSNKALLTKPGSGLDWAGRLQFAHP